MNKKKDEKWLDELISRTINTTKPQFDPDRWKQKYPEEFKLLKSRAGQDVRIYQPNIWRIILRSPATKLTAAAMIIVIIGLFIVHRHSVERIEPPEILEATKLPSELTTFASLTFAYRRGGMAAVEEQCDKVFKVVGPRPATISIQELLAEFNGT